jgi:hypothetical protein
MADARDTNKDGKVSIQEEAAAAEKTSAYSQIVNMFNNAGAPELGQWLRDYIKGDPSIIDREAELITKLQESEPYAKRFSGLIQLRDFNKKNPTRTVFIPSEAQYLATESSMKEILSPVMNMFKTDINTVIGDLIGKQISPVELQNRVVVANDWVNSQDKNIKQALRQYYGIGDTELLQYALDPERGTAEIQRAAGATRLGAQALESQTTLSRTESESVVRQLAFSGMSQDEFTAGQDAAIALEKLTSTGTLTGVQQLARIEGTDISTGAVLTGALGVNTAAAQQVSGLKSRERARFEGTSGGTNVLETNVSGNI